MLIVSGTIILVLVAGSVWWWTNDKNTNDQSVVDTTSTTETRQADTENESEDSTAAASIITYSDSGFRTSTSTVLAGSTIQVINESSEDLEFSSDPHPQHSDNPELNTPELEPGEKTTFVVREAGRWGFHNHLNDDHAGFITVTD